VSVLQTSVADSKLGALRIAIESNGDETNARNLFLRCARGFQIPPTRLKFILLGGETFLREAELLEVDNFKYELGL